MVATGQARGTSSRADASDDQKSAELLGGSAKAGISTLGIDARPTARREPHLSDPLQGSRPIPYTTALPKEHKTPKLKSAKAAAEAAATKSGAEGTKHVFVLIDESGSMRGLEEPVVTGCNEFIHAFKDEPDVRIWLAWFDYSPGQPRTRLKIKGERATEVTKLTADDYSPGGTTPLNDAIADSVSALDAATGEKDVVFLAVITDGLENASEHSDESIKRLLDQREEAGWGIVYIGANQDAAASARRLGRYKTGASFSFKANDLGVRATMRTVLTAAEFRAKYGHGKEGREAYEREIAAEHRRKAGRADVED